jgi:phospholipid/cholesterol/gamma-HCH transport system substrate-binding protein
MSSLSLEVRVGTFVLAALAVMVALIMALGDFRLTPGFEVHADFAYAGGLQEGAPVRVSGIQVGKVTGLSILDEGAEPPAASPVDRLGRTSEPLVRADLVLDREYSRLMTTDARLYIGTQGVVGESYVELQPGPSDGAAVAAGGAIRGVDAPRLHLAALQGSAVLDVLGTLVGADQELGLGGVGEALRTLIDAVGGIVSERRTELGEALGDLAATAADLRRIAAHGRAALGDGSRLESLVRDGSASAALLHQELPVLLERANASLAAVEALTSKTNDAVDAKQIEEFLVDLQKTMQHLEKAAVDAERVMSTIRRGQGTVGGLVTDPQVYDDMKEMLRDLKRNPWKLFWRD